MTHEGKIYFSSFSEKRSFRTLDGRPGVPERLMMVSRNSTCLRLQWEPPSIKNGVITRYQVIVVVVAAAVSAFVVIDFLLLLLLFIVMAAQ